MSRKPVSLLVFLIVFSGCSPGGPKYRVGDCVRAIPNEYCEKWEDCGKFIWKVLDIGVVHYRTEFSDIDHNGWTPEPYDQKISTFDVATYKIPCPKWPEVSK